MKHLLKMLMPIAFLALTVGSPSRADEMDEMDATDEMSATDETDEMDEMDVPDATDATDATDNLSEEKKEKRALAYAKSIANYKKAIGLAKVKLELHELCRSCSTGNCNKRSSLRNRYCRHYAYATYGGKRVRVCHQLPHGNQRYAGIKQAESSLNKFIEKREACISELEDRIADLGYSYSDFASTVEANVPGEATFAKSRSSCKSKSSCSSRSSKRIRRR